MAHKYPNHPQYIPIIKWQSWEQRALKETWPDVVPSILPCIEVRDSSQHSTLMTKLADVWPAPALIDYANPAGRLTDHRPGELRVFLDSALQRQLPVVPVLHPTDALHLPAELFKTVKRFPEIALRLRIQDLSVNVAHYQEVATARERFVDKSSVSRLIVDLGATPKTWSDMTIVKFATEIKALKKIGFDHIHLASGAFPDSLSHVKGSAEIARRDWSLWNDINAKDPAMLLGYSDYGALSPNWSEEALERRGGRSVIRYTRDKDWLLLRADGNTKPHSIAISSLLVGAYAPSFKGPAFSFGDKLLADRADPKIPLKKKLCGHAHIAEFWTHHTAMVVKEQY